MDIKESLDNWRMWCRLCAKVDPKGNMSVFFKDELEEECCNIDDNGNMGTLQERTKLSSATKDTTLAFAIEKHFCVHMLDNDDLPKVLCVECSSLMTKLANFSERVEKVQKMFGKLQATANTDLDLHGVRLDFNILDEDSEQMSIIKTSLPELHFFEPKPLANELEDQLLDLETCNINPIEVQEMEIKRENTHKAKIDGSASSYSDEDYDIGVDEDDANDVDFLVTKNKVTNNEKKVDETSAEVASEQMQLKIITRKTRKRVTRRKNDSDDEDADDDDGESGEKLLLTCTECPRKFKRIKRFRHHLKIVHAKEPDITGFSCSQCSRTFTGQYKLKLHMRTHLPLETRKIIPCPYCEKKFTLDVLVQKHVKNVHLNERDFICEECGAALCTNESLQTHLLIHTGEKPFKCKLCPSAFKEKRSLNRHMEIHDSSKPVCPECGMQLSSRTTLKQHMLVHSDEMNQKCEQCGRAFKSAKTLKNHLILHTGLRPYTCEFCNQTFSFGSSCRLHKKKVHPKELAALEASGAPKPFTRNIPKLEVLKAMTKAVNKPFITDAEHLK